MRFWRFSRHPVATSSPRKLPRAVDATVNQVRMVGAIRMAEACLKCHDGKRGDLLGSFSYELRRDPPLQLDDAPGGED